MGYQIVTLFILASFYLFYLAKLFIQKRQAIKTNQVGRGDKPGKVILIERIMSLATVLAIIVEVLSVLLVKQVPPRAFRIVGVVLGIIAVTIFALATYTMKNNWRVGIPEEKTSLVTGGIYQWSRNPAFVGFDLLYLSICLMFFNIPLLLSSVWAAVMLHLQILQEEVHMTKMFGEEYLRYRKHTFRYWGKIRGE